jgi:thioredoxin-like negative regulator of GroEL
MKDYPNELHSIEDAEKLVRNNPAVLLYFYSDNCAPCISLRPKIVELVCDRYPRFKLYFINSEAYPEVAAHFNSLSNPTLIIHYDGKEHQRFSKYIGIPQLSESIRKPYYLLFEE